MVPLKLTKGAAVMIIIIGAKIVENVDLMDLPITWMIYSVVKMVITGATSLTNVFQTMSIVVILNGVINTTYRGAVKI